MLKAGVAERGGSPNIKISNLPTAAGRRPRRKPCCLETSSGTGAKRRDRACTGRGERGDPKRAAAPRCTTFVDSSEAGRAMGVHLTSSVNIKRRRGSSDDGWLLYKTAGTAPTFCFSLLFTPIFQPLFWGDSFALKGDSLRPVVGIQTGDHMIQVQCRTTREFSSNVAAPLTAAVEAISTRTTCRHVSI